MIILKNIFLGTFYITSILFFLTAIYGLIKTWNEFDDNF